MLLNILFAVLFVVLSWLLIILYWKAKNKKITKIRVILNKKNPIVSVNGENININEQLKKHELNTAKKGVNKVNSGEKEAVGSPTNAENLLNEV